jgi:hypothetical protein
MGYGSEGVLLALSTASYALCKLTKSSPVSPLSLAVGKSAFGCYLLWRAVQARRTVVYYHESLWNPFIFHADGRVEVFPRNGFFDRVALLCGERSTLLIIDSATPHPFRAFTIAITSPVLSRYKEFLKGDAAQLTFPVHSQKEIADLWSTCFSHVAEAGVWERYGKWGGIPRYVLKKVSIQDQNPLANAVKSIDLDGVLAALASAEKGAHEEVSHRLFHLKPVGETADGFVRPSLLDSYCLDRIELGSIYIRDAVAKALKERGTHRLLSIMAASFDQTPTYTKLFADVYEELALAKLEAGGKFRHFNLTTGKDAGEMEIPAASGRALFKSAADIPAILAPLDDIGRKALLLKPTTKNYASLDAVIQGGYPVNVTLDLSHDLKLEHATLKEGLLPVMDALEHPSGQPIHFFWVLPRSRYEARCASTKRTSIRGDVGGRAIVEFAVQVDLP